MIMLGPHATAYGNRVGCAAAGGSRAGDRDAGIVGTATIETVVGPVLGYSVAAFFAWQISRFFGTADNVIKALAGTVDSVQARLAVGDLPQPYWHPAGY